MRLRSWSGTGKRRKLCNGHSQMVRVPLPERSRRRGDGGTGVDADADGHQPPRDTAFIDEDALLLSEPFSSSYMQRSHGTIEAGPTRGQCRSLGIARTTNNLREGYQDTKMSYGIERRTKATTSMGVISCRSREASSIPNYIRINATTECYRRNLRS